LEEEDHHVSRILSLDFSLGKLELSTNDIEKLRCFISKTKNETGTMHGTSTEMNRMHIRPTNLGASCHKISLEGANA
jgi:hypothetical protein